MVTVATEASLSAAPSAIDGTSTRPARRIGRAAPQRGAGRGGTARVDSAAGFTLVELLVVLVLVGLVAALAWPNLERLQAAVVRGTERDYILDQLVGLGRRAMLEQRSYVVVGSGGARDPGLSGPVHEAADPPAGQPGGLAEHASDPRLPADHAPYPVDLPEGWALRLDQPLVVRANGVCLGAGLTLYHMGAEDVRIELDPPYCAVDPNG